MSDLDEMQDLGVVAADAESPDSTEPVEVTESPEDLTAAKPKEKDKDGKSEEKVKKSSKIDKKFFPLIELICVIAIMYLGLTSSWSKFKFTKFAPFRAKGEGIIASINQVKFVDSITEQLENESMRNAKYCTEVSYKINGRVYTSVLYSKAAPTYSVGDAVVVTVNATDLQDIIKIEME